MPNPVANLLHRAARRFTPVRIDASRHPADLYYAQLYLQTIFARLTELGENLKVLDAGCGTGRLLLPVARCGHELTGIDYHHDSLRVARQNLDTAGVKAELIESDLVAGLKKFADARLDAVMAIESIYISEVFEQIVDDMVRVLRPGGLLFLAHRTRFYYLTRALAEGHFDDAEHIAGHPNGRLHKGSRRTFHHWQTRRQIETTYAARGMELLSLHAIGVCSGFGEDAMSAVCDPGELDEAQRAVLRRIETCDDDLLITGWYVLAVARKPG